MTLRAKLMQRMDALKRLMESNVHLDEPEQVIDLLDKIKFAWSSLSGEDRQGYGGEAKARDQTLAGVH